MIVLAWAAMNEDSHPVSWGPRNDRGLLVLVSLADSPKHGYALLKDIEDFAGVSLSPGTLYSAIARLEDAGLVEPVGASERRRPYRLTMAGRTALSAELKSAAALSRMGLRRLQVGIA
jgi:DNA-binding PadR family transcriptional regulator